jgi:hypothetical protein
VLLLASPLKKVFLALDFVARQVLFLHEILTHQIVRSSSLSTHARRSVPHLVLIWDLAVFLFVR